MSTSPGTVETPSRRRSGRIPLRVEVVLRGADGTGENFEEKVETTDVSKYGARVNMKRELKPGAVLRLERPGEGRSSAFRVVYQSAPDAASGLRETGIEFVGVDGFWGIQFPPDKNQWG